MYIYLYIHALGLGSGSPGSLLSSQTSRFVDGCTQGSGIQVLIGVIWVIHELRHPSIHLPPDDDDDDDDDHHIVVGCCRLISVVTDCRVPLDANLADSCLTESSLKMAGHHLRNALRRKNWDPFQLW